MATSKSAKIQAEMERVKAKISEAQARLKELEQKHREAENEEIVDIVRGMSVPLDELPLLLQKLRGGRMKKFRVLAAALCAAVLMCGFATPAYAGGVEEYEDGTVGVETGAPAKSDDFVGKGGATERANFGGFAAERSIAEFVPTRDGLDPAEPASEPNPLTPDGQETVPDNATDQEGKEFFTITTADEAVFYLVIDRQKSTENVYFLNAITVADLMALAENTEGAAPVTPAPVPEPDPEPTPKPEPQLEKKGGAGPLLLVLAVVLIGGEAGWYFKIYRPKQQRAAAPEEDYDEAAMCGCGLTSWRPSGSVWPKRASET